MADFDPIEAALATAAGETPANQPTRPILRARPPQGSAFPNPTEGAPDLSGITSRIEQVEGTGRNPRSTAQGVGQFTDATWLGTYRRHANAQGMSDQQVLALRNDPTTARAMLNNLAQDNANGLAARGHPVTPATLYLAHGFGLGGAHAILAADPNTPIDRVVGPGVMQANPNLAGLTAGQVVGQFDRKMAGGSSGGQASPASFTPAAADPHDPIDAALSAVAEGRGTQTAPAPVPEGFTAADMARGYRINADGSTDTPGPDGQAYVRTGPGDQQQAQTDQGGHWYDPAVRALAGAASDVGRIAADVFLPSMDHNNTAAGMTSGVARPLETLGYGAGGLLRMAGMPNAADHVQGWADGLDHFIAGQADDPNSLGFRGGQVAGEMAATMPVSLLKASSLVPGLAGVSRTAELAASTGGKATAGARIAAAGARALDLMTQGATGGLLASGGHDAGTAALEGAAAAPVMAGAGGVVARTAMGAGRLAAPVVDRLVGKAGQEAAAVAAPDLRSPWGQAVPNAAGGAQPDWLVNPHGQARRPEYTPDADGFIRSPSGTRAPMTDAAGRQFAGWDDHGGIYAPRYEPAAPQRGAPVQHVAELSGDEIAPKGTPIADLRRATRDWLNRFRQSGQQMVHPELGPVQISRRGVGEAINKSPEQNAGDLKLRATPAIPHVVSNGDVTYEPNVDAADKPFVRQYARVSAPVSIDGQSHKMDVLVEQRHDGNWYYNHDLPETLGGRPLEPRGVSNVGGLGTDDGLSLLGANGRPSPDDIAAGASASNPSRPSALNLTPMSAALDPQALGSRGARMGLEANTDFPPEVQDHARRLVGQGVPADQALREAEITYVGAQPNAAQVSRNPVEQRALHEGMKLNTPAGQVIARQQAEANAALHTTMQGDIAAQGGVPKPGEASETAAQSLAKASDAEKAKVTNLYAKADREADQARDDTDLLTTAKQREADRAAGVKAQNQAEVALEQAQEAYRVARRTTGGDVEKARDAMLAARQRIRDVTANPPKAPKVQPAAGTGYIDLSPVREALEDPQLQHLTVDGGKALRSGTLGLMDAYAKGGPDLFTARQAEAIRQGINDAHDPMGGSINHHIGRLKGVLDQAMDGTDAGDAYKAARAAHRAWASKYDDQEGIAGLIKRDAAGNFKNADQWRKADGALVTSSSDRAFVQTVRQLKANGDAKALSRLKASVLQRAYEAGTGARGGNATDQLGNSPVSGKMMLDYLTNRVGLPKLQELFTPAELGRLATIGRAAGHINEVVPGASNPSGTASTVLNAMEAAKAGGKHTALAHGALMLAGQTLASHLVGGEAGIAVGMVGNGAKVAVDAARAGRHAAEIGKGLGRMATPAEARAFNDAHRAELARLLHTRGAARQAGTQSAQLAAALIGNRQHGDPALVAALKKLPAQSDGKRKALAAALVAGGR